MTTVISITITIHLVILITFTLRGHGENHSALSRCYVSSYLQGKEGKVYQLGEFLSKRAGQGIYFRER